MDPHFNLLSTEDAIAHLATLPGWEIKDGQLQKTFVLKDFTSALTFVGAVGHLSEVAQHHPDITVKYNKVTLSLVTHDAGGITDNDFALAMQIAKLS